VGGGEVERRNAAAATEVAKLQTFDRTLSKVFRFVRAYKLYKNEIERVISGETNLMNIIICSRWISKHLERKCYKRIRNRRDRI